MNEVKLYSKYSGLQKTDAAYVIENYLKLLKNQSEKDIILDIGCGNGEVLLEILVPHLKSFQKIVAADISQKMIKFAKSKFRNEKINFAVLDIAADTMPKIYAQLFDHIFSFYCLHWIIDQRKAMRNIFSMLKPGGDILLTFLASNPIYEVNQTLAKSQKWFSYMQDYNKYISPYHNSKDPQSEAQEFLEEAGFCVKVCNLEKRTYTFPNFSVLSKSVIAVSPFLKNIPKEDLSDYMLDFMTEVRKLSSVKIISSNNNESIECTYKLFIVYASKSE